MIYKATVEDAKERGEGVGLGLAEWLNAVHANGYCNYQHALAAAEIGAAYETDPGSTIWPAPELVEAAVRLGQTDVATDAYERLAEKLRSSGTDWALGVNARTHALLCGGDAAEALYREAIERLGRTRVRTDLARAHLLFGEWLRRERRPTDARESLRTAHRMFDAMGMEAFAERAQRELQATGVTARKRTVAAKDSELTAQEAQIARLARDGLSNPEIGARLFISAHTVQYHLRKVFVKLGINSRIQLARVLPGETPGSG